MQHLVFDLGSSWNLIPWVHGGGHEGGGPVELIEHVLEAASAETIGSWHLADGILLMGKNLHPLLVHFPIAFLVSFFVLDSVGGLMHRPPLRKVASGLLYLGALMAPLTVYAGLIAEGIVVHGQEAHELIEWHERCGFAVAGLAIFLALGRSFFGIPKSSMGQALNGFLSVVLVAILFLGADLGGRLVYQHGLGVHNLQLSSDHVHGP